MSSPPMDKADDSTPQFHSSRQNALPRSPTPSDNSPQSSLVSQPGNIASNSTNLSQNKGKSMHPASHVAAVPKTLQTVPSYAEYARMALPSNDSRGVRGAYPDAASNQPSRSREPRLSDNPTTADPAAASTSRERTSKNRKDTSRSRSGQPPPSVDDARGVAAPPISSSKSSGMFNSKEVPTSSRNVPLTRASQATGTDSSGPLGTEELGKTNRSLLPQADSAREGNTVKPLAQVVDRIPSAHPSPKPSTYLAPTLNRPSVSTSPSPSHVAPTIAKTASGWVRTPRSKLPNEYHEDARTGGTPSELPRPPDKDKGKAHSNERSHTDPSAPSGTPPLPSEHPASAAGSPSRPQPESGPRGLDRSTSRIRGNEGVGHDARRVAEGLASFKGETRPGPMLPSKSMQSAGQPYSAAVPFIPQKGTPTRSPPENADDISSKLSGDRRFGETHVPSLVQLDPPQEAVDTKPHVKPSDQIGHSQSSAPLISKVLSNMGKERGSQAQPGNTVSQPHHSQGESSGIVPNQQHRTDPLTTRQTGLPSSEHAAANGVPSFPHFRPVIAYVPIHPEEISNPERFPPPPLYEPSLSPGVPVVQEGAPSRSGTRIPSETRGEPKKLPSSLVLEAPRDPDDQGHMDRPEELKRLLLPTRDDALAAACPPSSQSVEVYSQMTSAHGVRQLKALTSPKIRDRSRSANSAERGREEIEIQHASQERYDPPTTDFRRVAGSRGAGSSDDGHRGRGPRETPDGEGPLGRTDNDARRSQGPSKPPVPEVVLTPPTRPTSPLHKPPGPAPPEPTPIARTHTARTPPDHPQLEPSRSAPTSRTRPPGSPRGSLPEETGSVKSVKKKKGILGIICPCLG